MSAAPTRRTTGACRLAALAIVVSAGVAGCGQVRLGAFPPDVDGGTPAKPQAAIDWEPRPVEADQSITAVYYGKAYTLVGFTDGEIWWSPVGKTPTWTRLDADRPANVRVLPHRPVSAFLVDEESGLSHLGIGYIGAGSHTIWVRFDPTSDWYDTGPPETAEDVLAFSRSPFDAGHVLAVTTSGAVTSVDGGMTWGTAWPDRNFPGAVTAIAEGRSPSPSNLRRAWLGDAAGGVYYTDADGEGSWPASPVWTRLTDVVFPARMVSAISVNPTEPAEIWVSFKGLDGSGGNLWRTSDYGRGWENGDNDRLPHTSFNVANSGIGAAALDSTLRIQYVNAVVSATTPPGTVIGLWSIDYGRSWWINSGVR
jgi:hypothetical protein